MDISLCVGCKSYKPGSGDYYLNCHLINKYSASLEKTRTVCPCVDCLIKSICQKPCPERLEFADTVIKIPKNFIRLRKGIGRD